MNSSWVMSRIHSGFELHMYHIALFMFGDQFVVWNGNFTAIFQQLINTVHGLQKLFVIMHQYLNRPSSCIYGFQEMQNNVFVFSIASECLLNPGTFPTGRACDMKSWIFISMSKNGILLHAVHTFSRALCVQTLTSCLRKLFQTESSGFLH